MFNYGLDRGLGQTHLLNMFRSRAMSVKPLLAPRLVLGLAASLEHVAAVGWVTAS
jgi:hypothetical protein